MGQRLAGKTVLITAAGQGIGRATAELFVSEGAKVYATDINEALLAELKGCETRKLDVTKPEQIAALHKEIGAVDACSIAPGMCMTAIFWDASLKIGRFPLI